MLTCILCSFQRRRRVSVLNTAGSHDYCVYQDSRKIRDSYRGWLQMESGSGCYHCAQPFWICRGKHTNCKRLRLLHHIIHTATCFDFACARDIVSALHGPLLTQDMFARSSKPTGYTLLLWLGRKGSSYGKDAPNIARFAIHWLDRLDAVCTQTETEELRK